MYIEELASKHGLNCYHEGVLPVRDENGIYLDDITCVFKFYYRGQGQHAVRAMISGLQQSLASMIEAGID